MTPEAGGRSRNMERCGFRTSLSLAGRLIAMAIGLGLVRGVGRGWTMLLGDLRRFTTAAGLPSAECGAGCRADRAPSLAWRTFGLFTLLRWWRGLAAGGLRLA